MARKADEDLLAELDSLGIEDEPNTKASAAKAAAKTPAANASVSNDEEDDLAELEKQLAARPATSRPGTPSTANTARSPKRADFTPSTGSSERTSSDAAAAQVRSSGDISRSYHQGVSAEDVTGGSQEKDAEQTAKPAAVSAWSWGSSLFSAATAAVKQAETLATQISANTEAQKWAEQMRGNIGQLQEFGTDLRSRALPTFTSLISHIAPPISAHERLQIHATHDIQGYPSLDPLIYAPFARIMAQVEGGDLVVLQRSSNTGLDTRGRSNTGTDDSAGYRGRLLGGAAASWTDGPWWRDENVARSLGAVTGLREGTRLARVSAEAAAKEFFAAQGGVEAAAKSATESLSETNPVRSSDIFLAIQAIHYTSETGLFAASATDAGAEGKEAAEEDGDDAKELIAFAIYLHDPVHSLSFRTLSQTFPARWADWLDGNGSLPESIVEIIHAGGVDPRDWIAEWMEEVLSLAVGVVAQRYVAKRMGVGENVSSSDAPASA